MFLRRPGVRLPALTFTAALLLSGCAAQPGENPDDPPLLDRQFAHLTGAGTGAEEVLCTFATRGDRVVLLGLVDDEVPHVTFRFSDDGGATWTLADLPEATATATAHTVVREGTFAARPGPDGGWLVLATSKGKVIGWFSADGEHWQRRSASGLPGDDVTFGDVVGTEQGWTLVGSTTDPVTGDQRRAIWTSADGVSWTKHQTSGPGHLAVVAASGSVLVAAGDQEPTGPDSDRDVDTLAPVSPDAGTTWSEVDLPEAGHDDGVATTILGAGRAGDGFVLTGTTYQEDDTYAPVLLSSPDGRAWRHESAPPQGGAFSGAHSVVEASGSTLTSVATRDADGRHAELVRHEGSEWVPVAVPEHGPRTEVQDLTVVGPAILATTWDARAGLDRYTVWRSTDGGVTFTEVTLPPAPAAGASLDLRDLERTSDGKLIVAGTDQGRDVIWRPSGAAWKPTPVDEDALTVGESGLATGPGGLLTWNAFDFYEDDFAVMWAGTDTDHLRRVHPAQLGGVGPYRHSVVRDARWIGDRWFLVGENSSNGDIRRSAVIATSTDGRVWLGGRAEKTFATGDDYSGTDPLTDLAGLTDRGRSMATVVDVQGAPLVFGEAYDGTHRRPAMWRSPDRTTWSLTELPAGDLEDVEIHEAAAVGPTVVVYGSGRQAGQADDLDWLWVSGDAGATWELKPIGPREASGSASLTATATAFVFVSTDEYGSKTRGWTSADATTWTTLDLGLPTLGPDTVYDVRDTEADGDEVALLIDLHAPHAYRPVVHRLTP